MSKLPKEYAFVGRRIVLLSKTWTYTKDMELRVTNVYPGQKGDALFDVPGFAFYWSERGTLWEFADNFG